MGNDNIMFTTTGGYQIELKPFITGRQKRHIMDAFMEDVELRSVGGEQSFSVQGNKANVATDRSIQAVVVSVAGPSVDASKPVLDQILDLPAVDYDEVMVKVEEITGDKKKEAPTPRS